MKELFLYLTETLGMGTTMIYTITIFASILIIGSISAGTYFALKKRKKKKRADSMKAKVKEKETDYINGKAARTHATSKVNQKDAKVEVAPKETDSNAKTKNNEVSKSGSTEKVKVDENKKYSKYLKDSTGAVKSHISNADAYMQQSANASESKEQDNKDSTKKAKAQEEVTK